MGIVSARHLSQATMRNIRQNLFFAFVYNAAGVPVAAGILYPIFGLLLSPIIAAAAMSLSSVSVIVQRHAVAQRQAVGQHGCWEAIMKIKRIEHVAVAVKNSNRPWRCLRTFSASSSNTRKSARPHGLRCIPSARPMWNWSRVSPACRRNGSPRTARAVSSLFRSR